MSKLIVSTLTKKATFNVMLDYDKSANTGFYRAGDSISVRVYATGPTFENTFIHSQEFKVQTVQELPTVRELSVFFVPENTTTLTAFCVYGSRLDDGYPDTLDPEFCTEIPVEWKVEVAIPEITMDQWAYFNTSIIKNHWDKTINVLPPYNVPTVATGTTTSIVPFDVMVRVTKDDMIYGTYDRPEFKVATVIPNEDGSWELPLDSIMSMLSSSQVLKLIFRYNDEVIHEQKLYYPRIFLDSSQTSISRSVASVFDIGGFYDRQPCMVVNMEQDYALIGRYMEAHYTSKYTYVEYSTSTDSVLIGPNLVLYGGNEWDDSDTWRSIVKDKTYYQDGQPEDFDDYTFQINGVLTGPNSLAITRKYKFIYPEDNIFLELEMLPGKFGSIIDNTIDSFYNKTLAINNKIVDNGIFDINDVSPTTGDTADYYVSVLSSTERDASILYEQQYIGSTTLGTTIFKPSYVYETATMNGVSYTGNGYQWNPADEIDISIGRFPVGTNKVVCAMPLNRGLEFTSDLKYVISKGYSDVPTAPSDVYGALIVGTKSLGTINAVAIPKITMDKWAYLNTDPQNDIIIDNPLILPSLIGTIIPVIDFSVILDFDKPAEFSGYIDDEFNTTPEQFSIDNIVPDSGGNWIIPIDLELSNQKTLLNMLKLYSTCLVRFISNGAQVLEQRIYHPMCYIGGFGIELPQTARQVFDWGTLPTPSSIVNIEERYLLLSVGKINLPSLYSSVVYTTSDDMLVCGARGGTVDNKFDLLPNDRLYYGDDNTQCYAVKLSNNVSNNTMYINAKFKFEYPADNIYLEANYKPYPNGAFMDLNVDPLYNKVKGLNTLIVDSLFDINTVAPTTNGRYNVSVTTTTNDVNNVLLTDVYFGVTGQSTPFVQNDGIVVNSVSYSQTTRGFNYTEQTSGNQYPGIEGFVIGSKALNIDPGYSGDLRYLVSKNHAMLLTTTGTLENLLIVGTQSLGTINAKVVKIYTPGKMNQLAISDVHLMGITPTNTINQVGAEETGEETTTAIAVASWSNLKEIVRNNTFAAGLTNTGQILLAWDTASSVTNTWISNYISQSTSWTDIIQIAGSGGNRLVGLKSDGTVLLAGSYAGESVSGWTGITQVATGPIVMGLKSDGTVVYTGGIDGVDFSDINTWTDIVQVATGQQYAVGLKSDGTVMFAGDGRGYTRDVKYWKNVISVSCGPFFVLGLTKYGTVVTAGGGSTYGETNVSTWTGIRQVYAGIQWSVGVKEDGTVVTTLTNSAVVKNYPEYASVSSWTTNI